MLRLVFLVMCGLFLCEEGFGFLNPAEGLAVYFWRDLEHTACTHSQTRAHKSWTVAQLRRSCLPGDSYSERKSPRVKANHQAA